MATVEERFWAKVDRSGECWNWTAATNAAGYGKLSVGGRGRTMDAHRLSFLIHFGPFDRRLFICHRCDNPRCVNPAHLYAGTAKQNSRDMVNRGRQRCPAREQTRCKYGHEFTEENTRVVSGRRRCVACMQRYTEERRADHVQQALYVARRWPKP